MQLLHIGRWPTKTVAGALEAQLGSQVECEAARLVWVVVEELVLVEQVVDHAPEDHLLTRVRAVPEAP